MPPQHDHTERALLRPQVMVANHHIARQLREVGEREDVCDHAQKTRVALRGEERAGDDRHRQVDDVDDRRRALGRAHKRREPQPHRRERGGADHEGGEQREGPARQRNREEDTADRDDQRRLDQEDDERRPEHREDVGNRGQRRGPHALQDTALPAHDHRDRQAGERGGRDAVADHPRLEERRGADVLLADRVVAVDRAEDQEEDHRQEEGEERRLAAAPEEQLLGAELVQEKLHSTLGYVRVIRIGSLLDRRSRTTGGFRGNPG